MNLESAATTFANMPPAQQISVLATYAFNVTVAARGAYEAGTENVLDPPRLRELNEVQHRVLGQLVNLLCENSSRYPDEVLVRVVVRESDHELLTLFCQAIQATA